jgi:hypothetical protein
MAPKKEEKKCPYYDRGFCQYRDACKNKHPDKVCSDTNCSEEKYDKRHPNPCTFSYRCKFNKKKSCLFSHVPFASDDDKGTQQIKALSKKFENFEKKIQNMQSNIDRKDLDIQELKTKFEALENIVKNVEKETSEIEGRVLNESISVLENSMRIQEKETFKCGKCHFTTESERGL